MHLNQHRFDASVWDLVAVNANLNYSLSHIVFAVQGPRTLRDYRTEIRFVVQLLAYLVNGECMGSISRLLVLIFGVQ